MKKIAFFDTKPYDKESFDRLNNWRYEIRYFETRLTAAALPLAFNIAWYEQKAVIVLLALLYLGVKNIHLGPTLPAFLSSNVAKVLVENFGIAGIGSVDDDMKLLVG